MTNLKEVQPIKACTPILCIDAGKEISPKLKQRAKAYFSIVCRESGSFIFLSPLQPAKVRSFISVTESGNANSCMLSHSVNALPPMKVTVFGIFEIVILQQSQNAPYSILLRFRGSESKRRFSHMLKEFWPMTCREFGRYMRCRFLQPTYLQPIITQYFIDNKSEIWLLFLIAHSKR